ncbi:hypothetical protein [Subtercola sp. YIM 133946]|uniref:hypothetical protein n=1 Tax=Subtercola sp. YIM 133946 TaxID=3118909 RepID=UPI002F94E546
MVLYANGQAPKSALVMFEGSYFSPDMAARVLTGVRAIRSRGVSITVNQGYRFLGSPGDRAIGASDFSDNEAKASQTSDGTGNQWYQLGRCDNGSTPSAATPGMSNHGDWSIGAVDTNCADMAVRDQEFAKVGLTRTISGETWHAANTGPPRVALLSISELLTAESWFAMATPQEVVDALCAALESPRGQRAIQVAVFQNDASHNGATALSNAVWEALDDQRGINAIARGVFQNDRSPDGFSVLSAAGSGQPNPAPLG